MDREVMFLRDSFIPTYARLIYNGFWYAPEREMLQDAGVERKPRVVPEEDGRVFLCRRSHDLPLTAAAAADQ